MQFNLSVKSSVFAAKYFDLREFARKSNALFDLQPLSEADANELEVLFYCCHYFCLQAAINLSFWSFLGENRLVQQGHERQVW